MSKRNLLVAVQESSYIERLGDFIRQSSFGSGWQLTAFTNPAALRSYMRGGYAVDLLVAQPSLLDELGELAESVLSAALVGQVGLSRHKHQVLQYQPLPQLLQSFAAIYASTERHAVKLTDEGEGELGGESAGGGASIISVYSPAGGIGKTTLALQLARQAAACGARVFYLNLEQWNAAPLWDSRDGREDFSNLLYTLQAAPDKAAAQIVALRKRHSWLGVDFIVPCENTEERLSITVEHAKRLLGAVKATGEYDMIVVDLDSRLDAAHFGVFQASRHVLWLLNHDPSSLRKTELAMQYGEQKMGPSFEASKAKFRFIRLKPLGGSETEWHSGKIASLSLTASVPFVKEWAAFGQQGVAGWFDAPQYRGAIETLLGKLGEPKPGGESGAAFKGRNSPAAQGSNSQPA
ncbi:AAA family ATPase [Paenibacillus sp. BC26]|uniref:AAA family ATPase n=1 Tax=Paenibacillus sp. BC26 TaxID=1881032 RepID=UPI0008EBD250|nr:AAA family ATPase [Paenibacillus sp. BC26]SFS47320.1 AAA domain-containing protein [Paenibacillus sp. BC26]